MVLKLCINRLAHLFSVHELGNRNQVITNVNTVSHFPPTYGDIKSFLACNNHSVIYKIVKQQFSQSDVAKLGRTTTVVVNRRKPSTPLLSGALHVHELVERNKLHH